MADIFNLEYGKSKSFGYDLANSKATTVTPPVSSHTKGAWIEVTSGSGVSGEVGGFWVRVFNKDNIANRLLIDVGIGEPGSQVVLIPNLHVTPKSNDLGDIFFFPVSISSGNRIWVRAQNANTTQEVVYVTTTLFYVNDRSPIGYGKCSDIGADVSTTLGTTVDSGATANTKGAWFELTSSSPHDIKMLMIAFGNRSNTNMTAGNLLVDVGIGSAGNEDSIVDNIYVSVSANEFYATNISIPVNINEGDRISVRGQSDIIDASDRLFDVVLYGMI